MHSLRLTALEERKGNGKYIDYIFFGIRIILASREIILTSSNWASKTFLFLALGGGYPYVPRPWDVQYTNILSETFLFIAP